MTSTTARSTPIRIAPIDIGGWHAHGCLRGHACSTCRPHFVRAAPGGAGVRQGWGRVIFRVDDVDAYHERLEKAKLFPESPRDAPWGERYFHIADPDGHELSFAQLICL